MNSDSFHLTRFYSHHQQALLTKQNEPYPPEAWDEDVRHLASLSIGMEEALGFLYHTKPSYEAFEAWTRSRSVIPATADDAGGDGAQSLHSGELSADEMAFWQANGYLVLRQAVSRRQCEAAAQAIWDFLGRDPADPATWYEFHEAQRGLMVMMTHHPALDAIRRSPNIRRAYAQICGTEAIWPNYDKVSFNPPECGNFRFAGSPLHWDIAPLVPPIPFSLQGLLYLTDTPEDHGAFHCVPGFQHRIDEWLRAVPDGQSPQELAARALQPVFLPGAAGDFIIWHHALPHGATPNRGKTPRLVQYLTYNMA
jgi:hypothetical protein